VGNPARHQRPVLQTGPVGKSSVIGQAILPEITKADEATLRSMLAELQRHKLDFPGLALVLVRAATHYPSLRPPIVAIVTQHAPYSDETILFLKQVVLDAKEKPAVRSAALHGLENAGGQLEAMKGAFDTLDDLQETPFAKPLRNDFIRDLSQAKNVWFFAGLTGTGRPTEQELAYAVLLNIADNSAAPNPLLTMRNKPSIRAGSRRA